jgi:hypothetical protein
MHAKRIDAVFESLEQTHVDDFFFCFQVEPSLLLGDVIGCLRVGHAEYFACETSNEVDTHVGYLIGGVVVVVERRINGYWYVLRLVN